MKHRKNIKILKPSFKFGDILKWKNDNTTFEIAYIDRKEQKYFSSNLKDYVGFENENLWVKV